MLSINEAFSRAFSKGISMEGRAIRSEFWFVYPVCVIAMGVLGRGGAMFGSYGALVAWMGTVVIFLFTICLMARRLHDRNMSAWWLALLIIPTIGLLILLFICALPGTNGTNRFDPDPLGQDDGSNSFYNQNNENDYSDGPYHKNDFPFDTGSSETDKLNDDFKRKLRGSFQDKDDK